VRSSKTGLASRELALRLVDGAFRLHRAIDENFESLLQKKGFSSLDQRDRAFAHALALISLRRKGDIEAVLAKFLKNPLPKSAGAVPAILITGAAQMFFMRVPAHAAIDTAVTLAKQDKAARHFASLINAVLRKLANEPAPEPSPARNTPEWLWKKWVAAYGEDRAHTIAASHFEEPPLDISVKGNPDHWARELGGVVLPTGSVRLPSDSDRIEELPGYTQGEWWIQDAAAALPAKLLGNVRNRQVLDVCAAPGGKTAQLAAAGAQITAVDISKSRMTRFKQNMERLKLQPKIQVGDILKFERETAYDAVLLDAPCSSTGTIRRHPDLPYVKSLGSIAELSQLQQRLLAHAAQLVKPEGLLLYCTCSLEPEEGENQIEAFLQEHPEFARSPIKEVDVAGMTQFITHSGDLRTLPFMPVGPSKGLDGFFASRLVNRGSD
jgi:16S rRNA (cytosine967-C5)-methyltransferase